MYGHMYSMPPIGKVVNRGWEPVGGERAKKDDPEMVRGWADVKFPSKQVDEFGHGILQLYKNDFMRATSAGFDPLEIRAPADDEYERFGIPEDDGPDGSDKARVFARNKLAEISAVSLPGNENAVKGFRSVFGDRFGRIHYPGLSIAETVREGLMRIYHKIAGKPYERNWEEARAKGEIQTVIFSKEEGGWTVEKAKTWLDEHELKSDKVDENEQSWRFRQIEPAGCMEDSYKTLTENLPEGVSMVACDTAGEEAAPEPEKQEVSSGTSVSVTYTGDTIWTSSKAAEYKWRVKPIFTLRDYASKDDLKRVEEKIDALQKSIDELGAASRQTQAEPDWELERIIDENLECERMLENALENLESMKGNGNGR